VPFTETDAIGARLARVRAACEAIGRPADTLVLSAAHVLCVGADEAEFARRAAAIRRDPAELRRDGYAGTVSDVVDRLGALAELGVRRVYLQVLDLHDLDHLELVAREVAPQLP